MSWELVDNTKKNVQDNNFDEEDINWNVENIFNNNVEKEIVLCVGKVQSGKTFKIFKCIDYAIEKLNYDIVILFAGTNNSLYWQTEQRIKAHQKKEKKETCYRLYFRRNIRTIKYIPNQKYVISILKHQNDIEQMIKFLYEIRDIKNKKILIIDDESDYASVNISNNDHSAIYKKINELYYMIYNGKLLQVTATPFANIMSRKSFDLACDRIFCWTNCSNYTGLIEFHEIRDKVYEIVDTSKDDTNNNYIYNTLKFFVCSIINNWDFISSLKDEKTCLFNIDDDTDMHNTIYKKIELCLHNLWNNRGSIYEKEIVKSMDYNTFQKNLKSIYANLAIILFNGENKDVKKKEFNIYVGGIKVSRGFSFENLITELILNSPKSIISVDTLLQRCRWFGTRRKPLLDKMKIFMNQRIYDALEESINYVNLLSPPGEHKIADIYNAISILDEKSVIVKSTSKE